MKVVYLGLISKVFNAVFNAILAPVFKFISSLLETALGWIFDKVLGPFLINVLDPLFKGLVRLVIDILGGVLYSIYASCLSIIDSLQAVFNIFAGLEEVTYTSGGVSYTGSLLEVIFHIDFLRMLGLTMIAVSLVLMLMFAVIATVRSTLDTGDEIQRPVSKILTLTIKSMFKMFLIPLAALFAIVMSCEILRSVDYAFTEFSNPEESTEVHVGGRPSLSRMVFVVSSLDAAKDPRYNISGKVSDGDTPLSKNEKISNIGINDDLRKPFYYGNSSYSDKDYVGRLFNFGRFDYLIGFGGCAFLILVLGICLINFITRIFEVLLLYLVSPFFASVMPLDDGEKFKAWQEMFVAKLFSGYGTVIAMQIYMILCPQIMGDTISFGTGSAEANYLIRFIFLLGGAWATVKAGPTITQLINYQAGQAEMQNARDVTTAMVGTAYFAGGIAKNLGMSAIQRYSGWKMNRNMMRAGALAESDKRIAGRLNPSGTGSAKPGKPGGMKPLQQKKSASSPTGTARRTGSYFNGKITTNKTEGGKSYLGLDLGKFARFGRDEQGRFRANFLGFGYRENAEGKIDKINALPFLNLKRDENGSFKISKLSLPGTVVKRAETVTRDSDGHEHRQMGDLYFKQLSPIGLRQTFDTETGKVERTSILGAHYAKNSSGEYVKTHRNFLGDRIEYEQDGHGGYRPTEMTTGRQTVSVSYDESGQKHVNYFKYKDSAGRDSYIYRSEDHRTGGSESYRTTPEERRQSGSSSGSNGSNKPGRGK